MPTSQLPRKLEEGLKKYSELIIEREKHPPGSDQYDDLDGEAFYLYLEIIGQGYKQQFEAVASSRDFWREALRKAAL